MRAPTATNKPNKSQRAIPVHVGVDGVAKSLASQVWTGCAFLAVLGSLTANPIESIAGALVPAILFQLLWRTGETPTLLFCATFQWLQAYAPIVWANLQGKSLAATFRGPELQTAAWLSFIGVVVLAAGIHVMLRKQPRVGHELNCWMVQLNPTRLVLAYLATWVIAAAFEFVLLIVPGLHSLGASLLLFKWVPLYLLAYRVFTTERDYQLLLIPVAIEIVVGLTGFFSSFKSVLFLLLVVSIGATVRTPRVPWRRIAVLMAPTMLLVVIWQAVKGEHREFISGNTGQQVVVVGFRERAANLGRLIGKLDADSLAKALESGVERVGYLKFFAYSIRNVPARIPHENGRLWIGAVEHVLMPRVLFPNKPAIDDSKRTNKYTLQHVAGVKQGTSISIGYMGESYIDFGMYGMFVPIFLLGMLYGQIYRWFLSNAPNPLLGLAFATSLLLFSASFLETSNIKIFGGVIAGYIIFAILVWSLGIPIWSWLCKAPATTVRKA